MKIIFFLFLCLSLSSCSAIEIENYAIIVGLGLDIYEEKTVLTAEIIDDKTEGDSEPISIIGRDIEECYEILHKRNSSIPYLNHCRIIVLGEDYLEGGIRGLLNYVIYNPSFRITTYLCFVKDKMAYDVFNTDIKGEKSIADDIVLSYQLGENSVEIVNIIDIKEVVNRYKKNYPIIVPRLNIIDDRFDITGGAIFHDDRVVQYLEGDEVNIIKLLRNKLKNGLMYHENNSFLLHNTHVKKKFDISTIKISIEMEIEIIQSIKEQSLKKIEEIEKYLKSEILLYISEMKNRSIEPFDFKDYVYRFENDFIIDFDEYFKNAHVEIDLNIKELTKGNSYGI